MSTNFSFLSVFLSLSVYLSLFVFLFLYSQLSVVIRFSATDSVTSTRLVHMQYNIDIFLRLRKNIKENAKKCVYFTSASNAFMKSATCATGVVF